MRSMYCYNWAPSNSMTAADGMLLLTDSFIHPITIYWAPLCARLGSLVFGRTMTTPVKLLRACCVPCGGLRTWHGFFLLISPQSDKVSITVITTVLQRRKTNQPRFQIPKEESDWPSVGQVSTSVHRWGEEGAVVVHRSKLATVRQKAVLRGVWSPGAATFFHVCWSADSGCGERWRDDVLSSGAHLGRIHCGFCYWITQDIPCP